MKITLKIWNPALKAFEHEVIEQKSAFDIPQLLSIGKRGIEVDDIMFYPILGEVEVYAYPKSFKQTKGESKCRSLQLTK